MGVSRHPFQSVIERMAVHLNDAHVLNKVIRERIDLNTSSRQAAGGRGGGAPDVSHKTLNHAIVVAAVGAWEAFNEDLALGAAAYKYPSWNDYKDWYPITGSRGQVQTPSSTNVRRLYWSLFQYDPQVDWSVSVTVSESELAAGGSTWRVASATHISQDASTFLNGVVSIRHSFAHQDPNQAGRSNRGNPVIPLPGLAIPSASGKWNVNSHHAENAVSCILQLAVLTADGLSSHLGLSRNLYWTKQMTIDWRRYLVNSPAGNVVNGFWRGRPSL